jgi:hypothetical protein
MGDIRALLKIKCLINIVSSIQSGFLGWEIRTWTTLRFQIRIRWTIRVHKQWTSRTTASSIPLSISRSIINESNRIRAEALARITLPDRTDRRCSVRDRCLTMKPKIIKIATARYHEKFKIPRPFWCPLTFYLYTRSDQTAKLVPSL